MTTLSIDQETFDRNLHRGQPYSTSVAPYDAPIGPGGEMVRVHVALCKARRKGQPMCGRVIIVPWEHIPEVMSGLIDCCEEHHNRDELDQRYPSADEVKQATIARREAAELKWKGRR